MENELQALVRKYFSNTASKEELDRLYKIAAEEPETLTGSLLEKWSEIELDGSDNMERRDALLNMMSGVMETPVRHMRPFVRMSRIAIAAGVVLIAAGSVWFWLGLQHRGKAADVVQREGALPTVVPGAKKAVLTLGDGTKIDLASASNGALAQQGNVQVNKSGSKIDYSRSGQGTEVVYNTVSTPRGGEYQLELADGTKVWLNAASSLRYPTVFTGKDRMVELTGEAYFEVKHNAAMPFRVKVKNADVMDLATEFNVNAYDDEPVMTTTVIHGMVAYASAGGKGVLHLSEGQQVVAKAADVTVNRDIDVDQVKAWKDGNFVFNSTSLGEIMRQLARWYDLRVEFNGPYQDRVFSGIVSRSSQLSDVLNIMKQAQIKFQLEGNLLIVGK